MLTVSSLISEDLGFAHLSLVIAMFVPDVLKQLEHAAIILRSLRNLGKLRAPDCSVTCSLTIRGAPRFA